MQKIEALDVEYEDEDEYEANMECWQTSYSSSYSSSSSVLLFLREAL